jgi:hypothetical protein
MSPSSSKNLLSWAQLIEIVPVSGLYGSFVLELIDRSALKIILTFNVIETV